MKTQFINLLNSLNIPFYFIENIGFQIDVKHYSFDVFGFVSEQIASLDTTFIVNIK